MAGTSCVVSVLSVSPTIGLSVHHYVFYTQYALLHSIWLYIVISLYKVGTPLLVPRRSSLRQDDSFPRVTRQRLWVPDLNLWRLFSEAQAEEHPGAPESKVSVGPQRADPP